MAALDGFVLAGGRSTRMGVDKARLPLRGEPMAVAVARVVQAVCARVTLVRHEGPEAPWRGLPVILDPRGTGHHPLHGVATALRATRTERALVVSCDLPSLDVDSVARLVAGAGSMGAVAFDGARRHPLVAVYPRAWAERAAELAAAGRAVHALADPCPSVPLEPGVLANLNVWDGPGPVEQLVGALSWLDAAAAARVADGERARLAARGIVLPPPVR